MHNGDTSAYINQIITIYNICYIFALSLYYLIPEFNVFMMYTSICYVASEHSRSTGFVFVNKLIAWITETEKSLSGVPDYFGRNKISSGGDLSHYSSASLY